MRKIFKSFMLVAAAAMAFTSCQKEETAAPETVSATLTMHADVEQTKTYLDENNAVRWGKGEAVTLYVGAGETAKFFDSASADEYDGKASATFTFAIEDVAQANSYALGGIYPESAAMDDNKNAAQYKVILPATQNQVDGNYDPSAYIMVLKPEVVTELPAEYTASFRRAVALNKITLTGVKEDISSVEITVPEKKYLAGRRYMDLTTGESGEVYYDQSNKVTVNSSFTGNSIDVWFTSWGVELAEGDELSIKMTSATKTYTRTIAARAEGIKFVEGDLNMLTVNMSSATEETLDNFSGEYLIVNTDLTRAAQAWANGNNLPEFVLNARDGVVYESEGIENCKMTIEAQADGKYTIKDANGLYLYAASSSSNHLKGQEIASSWTIEQDGDKYVLTSSAQTSRNIMKYNEQSKIFSCYSSGQKEITLYKYSDIKVDTTPSISLTKNSDQVAFDATSYEFTYTTKNITGNVAATIKEGATMTNVSASANNGTVTVKFNANADAEQKTATIVLSYDGAVSREFVLTQAGKPAEGDTTPRFVKVSSAPADWSGVYILGYTDGSTLKTLCGKNSGGNYGSYENLTLEDQSILSSEVPNECVLTIESTTNGYSLNVNNTYLGYTSTSTSGNNYLWFNSSFESRKYEWTIKMDGENVLVTSVYNTNRVIKWNNASNGLRFACYTSSQSPIQLYKLMGGEPGDEEPKPAITVSSEASVNVEAAGATGTVSYTLTNAVADAKVSAQANQTWVTIGTITSTSVPFTVSENIGEQRTATITLSYDGAESKTVNITQAAAQSGGGETPDPEGNTFTKYTGELTEGDYIIVYQNGAMKNTESSDRLQYTEVTPEDDVISSPDAAIVWHIAKSGDYWTIYNAAVGKYAASTGAKNKAQLLTTGTDNKSLWTVTGTATYEFVNKANKTAGVNCNLRRNGTYGFACYATGTGGALTLYKKN